MRLLWAISGVRLINKYVEENLWDDFENGKNEEDERDDADQAVEREPAVELGRVLLLVALHGVDVQLVVDRTKQRELGPVAAGAGKVVGVHRPDHDAGQVLLVGKIGLESDGLFVVVTDPLVALWKSATS